jgi:hypothetical protein
MASVSDDAEVEVDDLIVAAQFAEMDAEELRATTALAPAVVVRPTGPALAFTSFASSAADADPGGVDGGGDAFPGADGGAPSVASNAMDESTDGVSGARAADAGADSTAARCVDSDSDSDSSEDLDRDEFLKEAAAVANAAGDCDEEDGGEVQPPRTKNEIEVRCHAQRVWLHGCCSCSAAHTTAVPRSRQCCPCRR